MGVPLKQEDKSKIESMLATLKPLISVIDGSITNVGASGSIPTVVPGVPAPIMLPSGFVNSITMALRAQRDFNDKLFNLVELMYQKMNE